MIHEHATQIKNAELAALEAREALKIAKAEFYLRAAITDGKKPSDTMILAQMDADQTIQALRKDRDEKDAQYHYLCRLYDTP